MWEGGGWASDLRCQDKELRLTSRKQESTEGFDQGSAIIWDINLVGFNVI